MGNPSHRPPAGKSLTQGLLRLGVLEQVTSPWTWWALGSGYGPVSPGERLSQVSPLLGVEGPQYVDFLSSSTIIILIFTEVIWLLRDLVFWAGAAPMPQCRYSFEGQQIQLSL